MRPDDAQALVDFHEHLSAETVYLRFFSSHRHLSPAEVERFTNVDRVDRLALVAERRGQLLAVARCDRLEDGRSAEVAFVVADEWQHQGIGSHLLQLLADEARSHGIKELVAEVLLGNRPMLQVFAESGFPFHWSEDQGTIEVRLPITSPPLATQSPRSAGEPGRLRSG